MEAFLVRMPSKLLQDVSSLQKWPCVLTASFNTSHFGWHSAPLGEPLDWSFEISGSILFPLPSFHW